ncbi:MAG: ribosomal RNA small subunit methyltransferase A, partial [Flavobacteriales bacterium]
MNRHPVKAKKHLGQHFLNDDQAASAIVDALSGHGGYAHVLEIGPGTGVLSRLLFAQSAYAVFLIDIDTESIVYLKKEFPDHADRVIEGDFLTFDPDRVFSSSFAVIGNFPYNISS